MMFFNFFEKLHFYSNIKASGKIDNSLKNIIIEAGESSSSKAKEMGDIIAQQIFERGEAGLFITADGNASILTKDSENDETQKIWLTRILKILSYLDYLENKGLISFIPLPNSVDWFYQKRCDSTQQIETCPNKIYELSGGMRLICTDDGCSMKNGLIKLSGKWLDKKYASYIIKRCTSIPIIGIGFEDFVNRGFMTEEQYSVHISERSNRLSCVAMILSVVVSIGVLLLTHCCVKTTINDQQFEQLIKSISVCRE